MDGFSAKDRDKVIRKVYGRARQRWMSIYSILIIMVFCLLIPAMVQAGDKGKVAVLPFRIHSLKPVDHLKLGLQEMFTVRMAGKGLDVVSPDLVNKHAMAFLPAFSLDDLLAIGKDLSADWIIEGSLTLIGQKISIDLKIVDISTARSPFNIFMVEDDLDRLNNAAERAAASIYNQITGVVQIDSLHVKGHRRIESDAVMAVIESKKGERLDNDKLDKDLRAIYKMGFFRAVNIKTEDGPAGKIVTFIVTEKPSISKVSFSGNKEMKDKDLKNEVGIKLYSILNENEIKQSVNRLKEYYQQKGYYNVRITDKIEGRPNNEVSLIFAIKEGDKVHISKIQFVGNTRFDDKDLKKIMKTSEKGFFSWLSGSGLLDRKDLEFDIHKGVSLYRNHGYIKAKADEPEITYEKGKGLVITIEIIEGEQYRVRDVKIEGDLIRPADELLGNASILREKYYNREAIRKDVLWLKRLYTDEGYAYADVVPIEKVDDKDHLVDVTYEISKKKRVRFERVEITGNTLTIDKVIRREIKAIEGEYFTGEGIRKSTQNLYHLGFFEDVEVQTKKGTQDDLMILSVNVKERPTGMFMVGAGYSAFDKTMGSMSLSQNNLFGKGQKLGANVRLGSRTRQFKVSFTEPWLFDKPLSAGIDLYNWKTRYDEYDKDSLGGNLRFGFPLGIDEYTRGSVIYTYDDAEISNIDEDASSTIQELAGSSLTSSMTFRITRNSKDRPFNTTQGSFNAISFGYSGGFLGGDVYFNKYEARSVWYFPLRWNTVFVAHGRVGLIKQRSGGVLPDYEKYKLGGIDSVRGYSSGQIAPIDPLTGDRLGGEKMWVYNVEYRFPFIKDQGVVGLVFFDAGNVFKEEDNFRLRGRRSIGAGVRWYSPLGPLRLEYGRKLEKRADEEKGCWEFSIGGLF